MFAFLSKEDVFEWIESGAAVREEFGLKAFQDLFILDALKASNGERLLEMGGGWSRVANILAKKNTVVNADKFDGADGGPSRTPLRRREKIVRTYLGDMSAELEPQSFDAVYSISVLEHIAPKMLDRVVEDIDRVLKSGGRTIHAIDVYLFDEDQADHATARANHARLNAYRKAFGAHFELDGEDAVGERPAFKSWMASNPDAAMAQWNRVAPNLKEVRKIAQVVSLKAVWRKP